MKECSICSKVIEGRGPQAKYCSVSCKEKSRPTSGMDAPRYRFRAERREYMDNFKLSMGCESCGYKDHPAALTFDHLNPSGKLFTPSQGITRSWETLHKELAKCRILCANCHNIHTYNQRKQSHGKSEEA